MAYLTHYFLIKIESSNIFLVDKIKSEESLFALFAFYFDVLFCFSYRLAAI